MKFFDTVGSPGGAARSGPIDLDQMQHYAARKGWSQAEARKWLISNLESRAQDPHDEAA